MILYAGSANGKIVTINDGGIPKIVPDCLILGAGRSLESTGIVIADEDRFWYIPLFVTDLEKILDKMGSIVDQIVKTLDVFKSADKLLDSSTTVVGQATMTPSLVTGTEMKSTAEGLKNETNALKSEINQIRQMLA